MEQKSFEKSWTKKVLKNHGQKNKTKRTCFFLNTDRKNGNCTDQNFEKSREYYKKVLEIDPEHIQTHLNLISVYENLEKWKKAIREIEISRKLGEEKNDSQAISIAERKKKFIIGRMNFTEEDYQRKTQPPFD